MVDRDGGWRCDRCGFLMVERSCKVICLNCGQRWDCSDLTIWVGDGETRRGQNREQPERTRRDRPAD